MTLKDWFETRKEEQQAARPIDPKIDDNIGKLWVKCFNCNAQLPRKELEHHMMVCPECGYHFRINAKAKEKTNLNDAVITGTGKVEGEEIACAIMDFEYMGGSMGSVVGEKVTRIIELALEKKLPVVTITASGGARMQESALSLMQMAKTSCAVAKLNEAKLLYINILTDPTYGGVTASFGTIGDIIIAEQGARIGFAGRRVIEQTIRQKLPADFQTAEYLMKHGQLDMICKRSELKETLAKILRLHRH